jgi:hypothetical protein
MAEEKKVDGRESTDREARVRALDLTILVVSETVRDAAKAASKTGFTPDAMAALTKSTESLCMLAHQATEIEVELADVPEKA